MFKFISGIFSFIGFIFVAFKFVKFVKWLMKIGLVATVGITGANAAGLTHDTPLDVLKVGIHKIVPADYYRPVDKWLDTNVTEYAPILNWKK